MHRENDVERLRVAIAEAEMLLVRLSGRADELTDAAKNISLDAADRRAANALQGRGLGGALFGSKYRAAVRRAATADNARLAREVAAKKRHIAESKLEIKAEQRNVRARLAQLKITLREAIAAERRIAKDNSRPPTPPIPVVQPTDVKTQLKRLKARYEQGEITAHDYELERIKLLMPFT